MDVKPVFRNGQSCCCGGIQLSDDSSTRSYRLEAMSPRLRPSYPIRVLISIVVLQTGHANAAILVTKPRSYMLHD